MCQTFTMANTHTSPHQRQEKPNSLLEIQPKKNILLELQPKTTIDQDQHLKTF